MSQAEEDYSYLSYLSNLNFTFKHSHHYSVIMWSHFQIPVLIMVFPATYRYSNSNFNNFKKYHFRQVFWLTVLWSKNMIHIYQANALPFSLTMFGVFIKVTLPKIPWGILELKGVGNLVRWVFFFLFIAKKRLRKWALNCNKKKIIFFSNFVILDLMLWICLITSEWWSLP